MQDKQLLSSLLTSENIDRLKTIISLENDDTKCMPPQVIHSAKGAELQRKVEILSAISPFFETQETDILKKLISALQIIICIYELLDTIKN